MHTKKAILFAAMAAISSSFATAQSYDDSGWYLGGAVGQSRERINEERLVEGLDFPNVTVKGDDKETGYKIFTGYQFNRYFSVEGSYFDLGDFDYSATSTLPGTVGGNIDIKGINLDLLGRLPLSDRFSAYARLGLNHAKVEDRFNSISGNPAVPLDTERYSTNPHGGLGLEYRFNDAFSGRLEAERFRISDGDSHKGNADLISVGLVYHFGAKPAPAPAPVIKAPEPTPAPVVVPPPAPRFEKRTLSSTELFGFDSAKLSMPQPQLDEIATALKGEGAPKQIVITGYTDRIGSPAYNQKLSEKRAQSVKDYLVSQGVAGERLAAEGKGEADPVVQCDEKVKAKLIECLKPNRRVEIDEFKVVREVKAN